MDGWLAKLFIVLVQCGPVVLNLNFVPHAAIARPVGTTLCGCGDSPLCHCCGPIQSSQRENMDLLIELVCVQGRMEILSGHHPFWPTFEEV